MNFETKYFPQIDVLRFIAVVAVIINHWMPEAWVNVIQPGRLGVDLFFVISGFLITRVLFVLKDHSDNLGKQLKIFFIRRVLRIFPIYYFIVLISYFFSGAVFKEAITWNLLYGSNFYILHIEKWPGAMSHFWTLSVEEHFYLFWPFLVLLSFRKKILPVVLGTILIGLGCRLFFHYFDYHYLYTYVFTFSCVDTLAFGGLLAWLYCYRHEQWLRHFVKKKIYFVLTLLGLSYCIFSIIHNGFYENPFNTILFRLFSGMFFFFIIGFAIQSKRSFLQNTQLVFLGKMSYSMYLIHNFVPGMLMGVPYPENIYGRMVLYFIVLLIASYLSWKLIEMPFNKLKHRFNY